MRSMLKDDHFLNSSKYFSCHRPIPGVEWSYSPSYNPRGFHYLNYQNMAPIYNENRESLPSAPSRVCRVHFHKDISPYHETETHVAPAWSSISKMI
jgi:hypothetical protein